VLISRPRCDSRFNLGGQCGDAGSACDERSGYSCATVDPFEWVLSMGLFCGMGVIASLFSIEMATGSLAGNVPMRASSSNSSKCSASFVTPALCWVAPGDDMGFSAHSDGNVVFGRTVVLTVVQAR
jgi:hypothetical protein